MSRITALLMFGAALLACACTTSMQGRRDHRIAKEAVGAVPDLPEGARTHWIVADPEEIVTWRAFDPATVRERLPSHLRFITIGELADGAVPWAKDFLAGHPGMRDWGVSFLEFARMGTFAIDGHSPAWPPDGAVALWFARVAPSDPSRDPGPGQPYLILDFWLPDRAYVRYMRKKGYYATYGLATLHRDGEQGWSAALEAEDLKIFAQCTPTGPVSGGPNAAGMQALFPPVTSSTMGVVRIAFAGHRTQDCASPSAWRFHGVQPPAGSVSLGSSTFQYGYHLQGGSYPVP